MRKLLLGLGFALSLCAGAQAQPTTLGPGNAIICNNAAQVAIGTTGLTKVVTGAVNKTLVICGWSVTNTGASGTFQIAYGTGTNCGSNTVNLTPVFSITSTAPATDHQSFAIVGLPFVASGTAFDLCFNPSVATIAAIIWYVQF